MSPRGEWQQARRERGTPRLAAEALATWLMAPYQDQERRAWVLRQVREWAQRREGR